jgi:hypothetical protein
VKRGSGRQDGAECDSRVLPAIGGKRMAMKAKKMSAQDIAVVRVVESKRTACFYQSYSRGVRCRERGVMAAPDWCGCAMTKTH